MKPEPGTQLCDHRSRGNVWELLDKPGMHFLGSQTVVRLTKMCLNETCSKLWRGKHLSYVFAIPNGLKRGHASLPLFFTFAVGGK
jgi:hypothetical protein